MGNILFSLFPRPDTWNVAPPLLLQVFRKLLRINLHKSIEKGEDNDQERIENHSASCLHVKNVSQHFVPRILTMLWVKAIRIVCGVAINELAKITGITPATLILSGKYELFVAPANRRVY